MTQPGIKTHVSSVAPLFRDFNSGRFTNCGTVADARRQALLLLGVRRLPVDRRVFGQTEAGQQVRQRSSGFLETDVALINQVLSGSVERFQV